MAISTHSSSVDLDVGVGGLVAAAAEGDAAAWSAIVDRYSPMIYGIARSFRLDAATAADVSQTVWLRLVENLGRLREPEHVGAWLAATTRHECLRIFRLAQRQVLSGDEAVFDGDGDAEPVEAGILRAERDDALWNAFDGLSDRCRQLLRVVVADPAPSYEEVAAAVGIAPGSVGPTRGRCLECLRRNVKGRRIDLLA